MTEVYKQPNNPEQQLDAQELEAIRENALEKKAEQLEKKSIERSAEIDKNDAKREALEKATSSEKQKNLEARRKDTPERKRNQVASKVEREKAYKGIMKDARSQMSAPSRAFSKVIHNAAIEKTSEFIGSTVARPNAILAGSVSAFIIVLGVYLIAHFFGYPLSGAETIIAFVLGWVAGIVYDFLRVMVTGKTH